MESQRFFHYMILGTKALFYSAKKHLGQGGSSGVIRPSNMWDSHAWSKPSCFTQGEALAAMPPWGVSVPFCSPSHIILTCFCSHRFTEHNLVLEKQSNVFLWKWSWWPSSTAEKVQQQLQIKCRWAKGQWIVGILLWWQTASLGGREPKLKSVTLLLSQADIWCKDLILSGLI